MIHLFPTSRTIRQFYENLRDKDLLLPMALSVLEFESKALLVKDKILADADTRVILMQEASNFKNFQFLNIPQEFMTFLKNSQYIFRFFEELSAEKRDFNDLRGADTYAEFEEHLSILETLKNRYIEILNAKGLYDKITLPNSYILNEKYLKEVGKIHLHVEGYLSRFELEIYTNISKIIPVFISMNINRYSTKMINSFAQIGIEIKGFGDITFNLSKKEIIEFKKDRNEAKVISKDFSNRSLQVGYIFSKIQEMVQEGINPENIAIVLPDESFVKILKRFDTFKNLNFAMGKSFEYTSIFRSLKALEQSFNDDTLASKYRLKRLEIDEMYIKLWKGKWVNKVNFEEFEELVNLFTCENEDEEKLFKEELYRIKHLILSQSGLRLNQILQLFLKRLSGLSIDDVAGGKVTVMGVLETRGMQYDGIIIPDFNDNLIPKRSQKDLFLSSKIRHHSGLPDAKDRENLQRYFYKCLLQRAKKVYISYVQNEENIAARFINELSTCIDDKYEQKKYIQYLMDKKESNESYTCKELKIEYDFFQTPLSSSRLSTFLKCPRKYYFRYIKKYQDANIPNEDIDGSMIGNYLHKALHFLYSKDINNSSLHVELNKVLDDLCPNSKDWKFEKDIWKYRLQKFCENERSRFNEGWKIFELETPKQIVFKGVVLKGIIDRIDVDKCGDFALLDYKSGSFNKTIPRDFKNINNFQMQFYYLFVSQMGNVKEVAYYDLNEGELFYEKKMDEKIILLGEIIEELKNTKVIDFYMTSKINECKYCPFIKLCGKT